MSTPNATPPGGKAPTATCVLPRAGRALDLAESWRLVPLGRRDPTARIRGGEVHWAGHSPEGPAAVRITVPGDQVVLQGWGPGARWMLQHAPGLTGLADPAEVFAPDHPLLRRLHREHRGLRLVRLPLVFEPLVRVVLQQLVTFAEAARSWAGIVNELGQPAPGPLGLRVPPTARQLAHTPYYRLVPLGVLRRFAETVHRLARRASRIEQAAAARSGPELAELLHHVPGVGPWTTGMVRSVYRADPDAVPLGDHHLPHTVSWALLGKPRSTDAELVQLLEPFRPHRGRAVRLIHAARIAAPRRGPRMAPKPLPRR